MRVWLAPARPLAKVSLALAVVLGSTTLAACGGGGAPTSGGGQKIVQGGIFRLGSSSSIDSLNPFVAFQSDAYTTFEYIYPYLVQYSPSLKFIPDFATSWKVGDGGKTWTFHLVPGAKWSDGKPLTSADAAWTFNTIIKFQNGATANSAGYVAHMTRATAPNPTTLVLQYAQPVANVLSQVQQTPIMPEHIWSKYATGKGNGLKTFANSAPIVSGGPFALVKYTPKEIALFKRNPLFYGPKPHIDGFGLQFFGTEDAEITALKNGQLDGVESVPPTSVKTLKAAHFVVRSAPGDYFDDFIINSNPKQDSSHRELLNPLLREAFDYAIDRSAIVKTSLLGFGQPGSTIVPPITGRWSDPAVKPTPFDLAKANQLLDQAGFKMGPNGLRIADGHPMRYSVILPSDTSTGYGQRSFEIVQTDFRKIGVQLNADDLDNSAAYSAITANKYRSFELSMWDWAPLEDPDFILSVLTCNSWYVWSDTGYCNPTYDHLYAEQSAAINPAARLKIVDQMQQMIARDRPYLVLDYADSIEAHSTKWTDLPMVGGASWTALSKIPLEQLHKVG